MTNLINKLLARFGFQLVSTKPDVSLVEASVKFLNENPKFVSYCKNDTNDYLGNIIYVQEKVNGEFPQVSGKTYYKSQPSQSEKYFCDYNGDENVSFEKMYEATTFTTEQLKNKLK